MVASSISNEFIAEAFEEVASLLEAQHSNAFRIQAWRNAADTIRNYRKPIQELATEEGHEGLERLRGIGRSLANAIVQLVTTGHLPLLEQLRGDLSSEKLFAMIPGIGPHTAEEIHHELHIETLGELHAAAFDGRMSRLPGIGPKRQQAIRDFLASRFHTAETAPAPRTYPDQPDTSVPVAELLEIDAEYRRKATADQLFRISPRRFNPTNEAWLPILHTSRDDRDYTALYSNTARAHELGMTNDWVVIYRDDGDGHGQWTVITSQFGDLKGSRIVRGREDECRRFYAA